MAEQTWKYLPHVPQTKKPLGAKRKAEVADKQVLNLTKGLFPFKIVQSAPLTKKSNWLYAPIVQKNPKIGPIYHWVKEGDERKLYHGQKFQDVPFIFSEQQYEGCGLAFSYTEAVSLFEALQRYNFNFIVVKDALNISYSIEDLKEVYFGVVKHVLNLRGQYDEPLSQFVFDKKYECNRKFELQKYLMRNKVNNQRQKALILAIRRLDILIKKEEREQINLKKALRLQQNIEEPFELQREFTQLCKEQKVYTRQQYLSNPLNLPGKVNERLAEVLAGMSVPEKIIATEENTNLYDKLREKILLMFSIQRYIWKKENQKKNLEEKKKRHLNQEEDQKKNIALKMQEGAPKKKLHTLKN